MRPPANGPDLAALAHYLSANRDAITAEWMNAVREDTQIPSADRLTLSALQDHFPEMLEELITGLERRNVDEAETRETASEHGKARWRSGYRLDEVLRELARIREILLSHVTRFAGENLSDAAKDDAIRTISHFFDSIVATSARQFIREQDAEVLLRTRQLQHAHEQVQAATEQLREIGQSRVRLLRTVSHELRNFLNAVNLSAHSLLEESNPVDRVTLGASLTRSVGHLQSLLDRLRDYSEILSGEGRPAISAVDLDELSRELEARFRPIAERKGLRLEVSFSISDPVVHTDADKVREIARSLLTNAVNFTSEGMISLSFVEGDADRWIMRVEDTGSGIEPADVGHIFSEFHYGRTSENRHGIGLGLAISRHLAYLLGGEITFDTTVGKGSRFEVNLPRVAPRL